MIFCITEAATDSVYHVAKKMKIPFIIDIHGIGVIEIIELGSGYGSRALRIMNSLRWLSVIPKANAITVANPTLFSYISILNRNTFPIFGMTDITYFNPQGHRIALGKDPSKIQVLYAGNYFKWQGVDLLLDSFKHLSTIDSSFELTLIGSVGKKINSTGNFEKYGIHFQNQVDYAEIANYYRGADILIVPRKFLLSTYFALPQKLVDYMSSGKTIIATDIAPHCWALQVPPSGILCKPSVNGISRAIVKAKDPNLQELLSSNSRRKAIAYFDHIQQCKFLKNIFNEIIGC